MARCSTVRLKHKRDGIEKTINMSEYQMNIAAYADWKRVGETHAEGEVAVGTSPAEPEPEAPATEQPPKTGGRRPKAG